MSSFEFEMDLDDGNAINRNGTTESSFVLDPVVLFDHCL